jgi:hypothetical protein
MDKKMKSASKYGRVKATKSLVHSVYSYFPWFKNQFSSLCASASGLSGFGIPKKQFAPHDDNYTALASSKKNI